MFAEHLPINSPFPSFLRSGDQPSGSALQEGEGHGGGVMGVLRGPCFHGDHSSPSVRVSHLRLTTFVMSEQKQPKLTLRFSFYLCLTR